MARIRVFNEHKLPGQLTTTLDREQTAMITANEFDSLEIELHLDCDGHLDSNCPAWDHELNLYLCRQGAPLVRQVKDHAQTKNQTIRRGRYQQISRNILRYILTGAEESRGKRRRGEELQARIRRMWGKE